MGLKEYNEKIKAGLVERPKPLTPMEKHKRKPLSLRLAINAKCWDCCCGQREEIRLCAFKDCSLWLIRPYK